MLFFVLLSMRKACKVLIQLKKFIRDCKTKIKRILRLTMRYVINNDLNHPLSSTSERVRESTPKIGLTVSS